MTSLAEFLHGFCIIFDFMKKQIISSNLYVQMTYIMNAFNKNIMKK